MSLWKMFIETAHGWGMSTFILRFAICVLVGTLIGVDREFKNRGAGVKTHVLVCLGSALAMMTSEYIAVEFPSVRADMNRIGAQVISGVGFLGVGTIIVTGRNQVRGLTTAAGLWACASVGIAVGIGYVEGALIATIMIMFTLKVLNHLDTRIHNYARYFDLYVEFAGTENIPTFRQDLLNMGVKYSNFNISKKDARGYGASATLTIEIPVVRDRPQMLEKINNIEYIQYVEEL